MRHPPATCLAIELCELRKSYGAVEAVRGLSLDIATGQTVALLGPNGAGKSTAIDVALGLAEPEAGTARLFGRPPSDAVADGAVVAMLQTGGLIGHLSVRELVGMVASLYPHPMSVDEALHIAGLHDVAARRTDKLSGGQVQRARFALAVVADPDLFVLDEPTAALDVESRHELWQSIRTFADLGKTVLFATHFLEEADEHADRIVMMAGGRIVADGAATEIRAKAGMRTIRATLGEVGTDELTRAFPRCDVERRGACIVLTTSDSDAALRVLLDRYPAAHDIEVRSNALQDAFLTLTSKPAPTEQDTAA